jgi:site-specific DNA-cytosine methylase
VTLTVTDLFAGAGGSSTGVTSVPGVEVKIAANHWKVACDVHNLDWVLSVELLQEADITYRQLDYWCRTRLLKPREDIHGSGWTRSFTEAQVTRAITIRQLLDAGISLQVIRDHIDEVIDYGEVTFGPVTITIHPSGDTAA